MAATETPEKVLKRLRWPLLLTRAGMVAENLTRAFWPLWSLAFVFVGALLTQKRLFNEVQMRVDRLPGTHRITVLKCRVDRSVLVQKVIAGCHLLKDPLAVEQHALLQAVVHGPHHVDQNDIVAGFDDGQMKFGINAGFLGGIRRLVAGFHALEDPVDNGKIRG